MMIFDIFKGHFPGFQWDDSTIFHHRKKRFEDVDFRNVPRLCAFLGGVVAQEVIKKTGKWLPQLSGIQRERKLSSSEIWFLTAETCSSSRWSDTSTNPAVRFFLKLRFTPIEQWVHHVAVPRDGAAETPNFSWVSTKLGYCSDFQILMETCVGQKGGCHPPSCFDPKNQPGRAAHTIAFRG